MADDSQRAAQTARILHTADWQIGMHRWFLEGDSQVLFDEARLTAVENLFAAAEEHHCEAIVVAGDVFEDNLLDNATWQRILNVLENAPVPTFLLPGNHDPLNAASIYHKPELQKLSPKHGGNIIVLGDTSAHELRPGLEIIGAPLLAKTASEDLVAAALADLDPAGKTIRIAVGHGATDSRSSVDDPSVINVDHAADLADQRVVDYVALGDTHSHIALDDRGVVRYSGAPEVTDFLEPHGGGESRSGFALVVDIALDTADLATPATVDVTEAKVGSWQFLALEADVNSADDVAAFAEQLEAIESPRTTVIKYALRGTIDLLTALELDELIEKQRPRFAALYERERLMDLHVSPDVDELRDRLQLRGYPQLAADELFDLANGQPGGQLAADLDADAETATDALKLLFRLSSTTVGQGA